MLLILFLKIDQKLINELKLIELYRVEYKMSYDISIGDQYFNITYNVSKMFYRHNEKGIRFIYGKTGKEASEMLIDMLNYFIRNKHELESYNPENGWGSHDNTTKCLLKMCFASIDNSDLKWEGD